MRSNYKKLGKYIKEVCVKNKDLEVKKLLGVSITKEFITSIANIVGTDMSTYKIVRTKQFAYGPVTSRNGDKISVALLQQDDCIISTSYTVFEIVDKNELDPEYLMMWFRRPEFDRYARYKSHGSVREIFDWEEMCDIELPVPSIEKQREIVKEYNVIVNRIKLNEKLNQKLEATAQAVYKQWFVDFEFPISEEYATSINRPDLIGKPYKSNGGEMVYNKELEQELPKGWKYSELKDFGTVITGKTPSCDNPGHFGNNIPFVTPTDYKNYGKFVIGADRFLSIEGAKSLKNKFLNTGSLLITCIGSDMGKVVMAQSECITNQQINSIIPKFIFYSDYLFYSIKNMYSDLRNMAIGSSTMLMINKTEFEVIKNLEPLDEITKLFANLIKPINSNIWNKSNESVLLLKTKELLLSRMASKQLEAVS